MRRKKLIILVAFIILIVCATTSILTYFVAKNINDSLNSRNEESAFEATLEWGRLAPFPKSAEELTVTASGNRFTRSFRVSFKASDEDIEQWLEQSEGISDATIEELDEDRTKYVIKPGGKANYAGVLVDRSNGLVGIYVSWS